MNFRLLLFRGGAAGFFERMLGEEAWAPGWKAEGRERLYGASLGASA